MSIFALIAALCLEQWRPLPVARVFAFHANWVSSLDRRFNDGSAASGVLLALLAALPGVAVAGVLHYALAALWMPLAWLFDVAVLYLTMGFRQFSHAFSEIQLTLRMGEFERARQVLAEWQGVDSRDMSPDEVARRAIEAGLVASHRHVFAVLFWFLLLPGPLGAVIYRLMHLTRQYLPQGEAAERVRFDAAVQRCFEIIDWLPARVTAAVYAVVGNFEDAVFCWRTQARQWPDRQAGLLLAVGAGALGVRLGHPPVEAGGETCLFGVGPDATQDTLAPTVRLAWRSIVLWFFLLALVGVAAWAGA